MPWQNVWTAFNLISFWDAAEHTVFSFGYRLKVWRNHYCLKNSSMSEEIIKVWTWKKSSTSEFRLQAQCQKKSSMSKEIINSWRNYQCRSFGYRLNVRKNHQCQKKSSIPEEISNARVSVTGSMSGNHQTIEGMMKYVNVSIWLKERSTLTSILTCTCEETKYLTHNIRLWVSAAYIDGLHELSALLLSFHSPREALLMFRRVVLPNFEGFVLGCIEAKFCE